MRRPVPVALAAATLLVVLGIPFLSMRFTGIDAGVLPPGASSRVVDDALRRDFTPAFTLARVCGRARRRRGGAAVRAPRCTRCPAPRGSGRRAASPRTSGRCEASSGSPFLAERSKRLVEAMRGLSGGALVGGATAQFLDQKHSIGSRLPLALLLLCVVTYALLYLATRSVLLPLKTLVMNFLTLTATFGVLVLVFQDGRLEGLLDYRGQGALQLTLPVLLFAIAFGLATDYGVFLLTRIKEGWDAGLPEPRGGGGRPRAHRAHRHGGGAALLHRRRRVRDLGVVLVKEVGIGIALAVAIDASIVRVFLVPSLMAILGKWNWWPSRSREVAAAGKAGLRR